MQRGHGLKRVALDGGDGIVHQVELFQLLQTLEGALGDGLDAVAVESQAVEGHETVKGAVRVLNGPRDLIVTHLTVTYTQTTRSLL